MEMIMPPLHATMLEFLASLNENTLDGVYTARLTPSKFALSWHINEDPNASSSEVITDKIQVWLTCLTTPPAEEDIELKTPYDPRILKVLCFREYGDKVGIHFHIRFFTTYKDRKSIADHIKRAFPIPKGKGKGNEAYSVRDCKAKDKTIWKNASYIAKGKDCVFHHGYTALEVEWFCTHAAKYQKMEGKLKWEQILLWNKPCIMANLANGNLTDTLIETVVAWHQHKSKDIPQKYQFGKILHNISFAINKKYRRGMLNALRNEFRRKNRDAGYEEQTTYAPPTQEEPDWYNS